jgi:uncharacterized membrane protein YfcA
LICGWLAGTVSGAVGFGGALLLLILTFTNEEKDVHRSRDCDTTVLNLAFQQVIAITLRRSWTGKGKTSFVSRADVPARLRSLSTNRIS